MPKVSQTCGEERTLGRLFEPDGDDGDLNFFGTITHQGVAAGGKAGSGCGVSATKAT